MEEDSSEAASTAESEAAFALGRLDGALRHLPMAAGAFLAARLLRETLIAALRQEGHVFSERRFLAWFAGITTLTDASNQPLFPPRPPRAMVLTILTALSHSSWPALANLAARMDKALLAIADEETGSHHGDAHALVTDAGELLASLGQAPSPLPFSFLSKLSRAIAGNMTFAPIERAPAPITAGDLRIHVDRPPAPSPRWALEIQLGECWRAAGTLSLALPLTDLIRLDALVDDDDGEARVIRATALGARAHALLKFVDEARDLEVHICGLMAERRSTSRLPALYELLSGFGGLRSSQIEALLGVSRPGARKILAALDNSGTLSRTKLGGVRLYEVMSPRPSFDAAPASSSPAFSNSSAMAEYDAAMADIEQVLARHGVAIPEADE